MKTAWDQDSHQHAHDDWEAGRFFFSSNQRMIFELTFLLTAVLMGLKHMTSIAEVKSF